MSALAEPRKADVPEGRQVVEGVVISERVKEDAFSDAGRFVITVEVETDAGAFRVWGTEPKALREAPGLTGSRVRFTATLKRSDRDPAFGFFSRPSGAEVLELGEAEKPEALGATGSTFALLERVTDGGRIRNLNRESVDEVEAAGSLEAKLHGTVELPGRDSEWTLTAAPADDHRERFRMRTWPNGCGLAWKTDARGHCLEPAT